MNPDLKTLLPLLAAMGGGSLPADLLGNLSSGKSKPADLLPVFMQMMQQSRGAKPAASHPVPPTEPQSAPNGQADPVSAPSETAEASPSSDPAPARFLSPILSFADEKIVYHLTLLLK